MEPDQLVWMGTKNSGEPLSWAWKEYFWKKAFLPPLAKLPSGGTPFCMLTLYLKWYQEIRFFKTWLARNLIMWVPSSKHPALGEWCQLFMHTDACRSAALCRHILPKTTFIRLRLSTYSALEVILTGRAFHGERLGKTVGKTKRVWCIHILSKNCSRKSSCHPMIPPSKAITQHPGQIFISVQEYLYLCSHQGKKAHERLKKWLNWHFWVSLLINRFTFHLFIATAGQGRLPRGCTYLPSEAKLNSEISSSVLA